MDKADFDFKAVYFDKFIDYYVDELRLDLEEKEIEVKWTMPAIGNTLISADVFRLRQVLNNITNNAQKHFDKNVKILTFESTSPLGITICKSDAV